MTYTDEELDEVRSRLEKELADQGLTVEVTDPAVLAPLARGLNESLIVSPALWAERTWSRHHDNAHSEDFHRRPRVGSL